MANLRILVVDDEAPITDMLEQALEQVGYEVDSSATAADALERIRANLYDALILDFALPDMNGVALHSEVRKIDEELAQRTLFISGNDLPREKLSYFAADGGGFLPKPFDVWEVVARIRKIAAH